MYSILLALLAVFKNGHGAYVDRRYNLPLCYGVALRAYLMFERYAVKLGVNGRNGGLRMMTCPVTICRRMRYIAGLSGW